MPYKVGAKGSYGCSGYPALKEGTNEVMGCHTTRAKAAAQIYAINRSEGNIGKSMVKEGDMVMAPHEEEMYVGRVVHVMTEGMLGVPGSEYALEASETEPAILIQLFEMEEGGLEETEYFVGAKASEVMVMPSLEANEGMDKSLTLDCCPDTIEKQAPCWDGYVQRGMKPGANGRPVPNCVPAAKADDLWEDDDTVEYYTDSVSKAEGYSPPAGARSAARRAIKFKEQGKAKGAGTAVGWTRAGQLARGETLSLSTVKRMYSYFSRHEVDKKGKDWGNSANPSNGYIMWLAWGGDAGFSWSRGIVNREKDKALFADFGKDYTKSSPGIKFDNTKEEIGSYKTPNPKPDEAIKQYDGCGCETCKALNVSCENCPVCGPQSDSEMGMAAYDASIGKADEQQEPSNEQQTKQESFFNFRDMRPSRNTVRLGE